MNTHGANIDVRPAAPWGVGILGAGLVTQTIHLPTLAGFAGVFEVRSVMDVDPELAQEVAGRCGAVAVTDEDALINDPSVDVVLICSPHTFHARQVAKAVAAGKKAVLCEKPLATDCEELQELLQGVDASQTLLLVGAMHVFDQAWLKAREAWDRAQNGAAALIRSSIFLPPNSRFEAWASEAAAAMKTPAPRTSSPQAQLNGGILGLAIHDLPLIRHFLPREGELVLDHVEALSPWGYAIHFHRGASQVELIAQSSDRWDPDWRLEVLAENARLNFTFPPSYVHGGSTTAVLHTPAGSQSFGPYQENGYHAEWHQLALALAGRAEVPASAEIAADMTLALDLVDASRRQIAEAAAPAPSVAAAAAPAPSVAAAAAPAPSVAAVALAPVGEAGAQKGGSDFDAGLARVRASLPVTLAGRQDPLVLDGRDDWSEALAALAPKASVVVVDPAPLPQPRLAELQRRELSLSVSWPFADNPALSGEGAALLGPVPANLVHLSVTARPERAIEAVLLDTLATLAAVAGDLSGIRIRRACGSTYFLTGQVGNGVALSGTVTVHPLGARQLQVLLTDSTGGTEYVIPDGGASPATVRRQDHTGVRLLPTHWESGLRATLRRVANNEPRHDLHSLERFAEVLHTSSTS